MSKSFFENGIISALGNDIQVDTNLVRSAVTSLDGINNNLESAFDSVRHLLRQFLNLIKSNLIFAGLRAERQ